MIEPGEGEYRLMRARREGNDVLITVHCEVPGRPAFAMTHRVVAAEGVPDDIGTLAFGRPLLLGCSLDTTSKTRREFRLVLEGTPPRVLVWPCQRSVIEGMDLA